MLYINLERGCFDVPLNKDETGCCTEDLFGNASSRSKSTVINQEELCLATPKKEPVGQQILDTRKGENNTDQNHLASAV